MKKEINEDANFDDISSELSEDIEVVGPGQMLSEARIQKSLTQEQVAHKLNFCTSLVVAIENDDFDEKLPATFNRGYLRNYAKLVGISPEDIIASYESLGAAEIQRTEMQSFSNNTAKQAEHSILMWVSYLIIAILFSSTILWWVQGKQDDNDSTLTSTEVSLELQKQAQTTAPEITSAIVEVDAQQIEQSNKVAVSSQTGSESTLPANNATVSNTSELQTPLLESNSNTVVIDHAVFTFSGDCWVNIYDANNERVAWGIKKSGYVMTVEGKKPFRVTLGKPELASIVFNGKSIDMTQFNIGNIAKFTLPVATPN